MVLKEFFEVYHGSKSIRETFKKKGVLSLELSEHDPDRHKESLVQELKARVESNEAAEFLKSQLAMPSHGFKLEFTPPTEKLFVAKLFREPHAPPHTQPLRGFETRKK